MVWTVRGSNPGGGEIFRTCPHQTWGPPSLLYNGYWVFHSGKERPGHDADPSPPPLVPWSRKSTAIPLLPLRAVQSVHSLSTCTRAHFTLLYSKRNHIIKRNLVTQMFTEKKSLCDIISRVTTGAGKTSVLSHMES